MDSVTHKELIQRAARGTDLKVREMRDYVGAYLSTVSTVLSEADPERKVHVPQVGTLRVQVHASHDAYSFEKEERVRVPAYRDLKITPDRRLKKTLKAPLKKFYEGFD